MLAPLPAWAASIRFALLIANSDYVDPAERLPGAARDAETLRQALAKLGFEIESHANLDRADMNQAVRAFARKLKAAGPAGIGFVYFAGHGGAVEVGGENYLLPADAAGGLARVRETGLTVGDLVEPLTLLDKRAAIAVVVDACRVTDGGAPRPLRMNAPREPEPGFLVAYSTGKGVPASDKGDYARLLAEKLATPGLTLAQAFEEVGYALSARGGQIPAYQSKADRLCLAGCLDAPELDAWTRFKAALDARGAGDLGQIAAAEQLVTAGRSLAGLELSGVFLERAALGGADFAQAQLEGAELGGTRLDNAKLGAAQLGFASLPAASLRQADLTESRFYFVDAARADFGQASAPRSNWLGANLTGANFAGANLAGANFFYADLTGADFSGANLTDATLVGAQLAGANFADATLANTDLTGAIGNADALFDPHQRAGLCATEMRPGLSFRLQRWDASSTYKGGKAWDEFFREQGLLASGLDKLEACARRQQLAPGQRAVYQFDRGESMDYQFSLGFPGTLLDRVERERRFAARARARIDAASAAARFGPWIEVVGPSRRALTAALEARLGQIAPRGVARLDDEALTLFAVRDVADAYPDETWRQMAVRAVGCKDRDAAELARSRETAWPCFFPAGTHPQALASEHVALYRRWVEARARALAKPWVYEVSGIVALRHRLMALRPPEGATHVELDVLVGLEEHDRNPPRFDAAQAALAADADRLLGGPDPYASRGLLRLPRERSAYRLRVPVAELAALTYDNPGVRLTLEPGRVTRYRKATGSEWIQGYSDFDVLDVALAKIELYRHDGTVVATYAPND